MTVMSRTLTLRTKLLVAEYGRKQVVAALAQVEHVELDTIEREIDGVRGKTRNRRHSRPKSLEELLKEAKFDPQTLSLVKRIACAYENKRYLPELWRVRKFLESHGVNASGLRSRTTALPLVVEVLGNLSVNELTGMAAESSESARGDLGILTDHILGSSKDESRTVEGTARPSEHEDQTA